MIASLPLPDGVIAILGLVAIMLVAGIICGLLDRKGFSLLWLLVGAGLVLVNDFALTNGYGALTDLFSASAWNWQGKILALALTLAIAALPAFGWRRCGLTLAQNRQGRPLTYAVAITLCLIFAGLALLQPNEPLDTDTLAFQLTMPGLEEEAFYRGLLLLALDRAFRGKAVILGAEIGWGGALSCIVFGLVHGFGYRDGAFSFDWLTMLLTGGPAMILVWIRARTGSLVLPVLLHNFANSIGLVL